MHSPSKAFTVAVLVVAYRPGTFSSNDKLSLTDFAVKESHRGNLNNHLAISAPSVYLRDPILLLHIFCYFDFLKKSVKSKFLQSRPTTDGFLKNKHEFKGRAK